LLRRRCAFVNVGQEAQTLVGLVKLLKLRLPCGLNFCLLLSLLRFAQIEQEALLALAHLLSKLAQCRLPQTKRSKRLALLQAKLTILCPKCPKAFAKAAPKFLAL
jgi:hypothetical protein